MTETTTTVKTCTECGKTDIKNMGAHKRHCKAVMTPNTELTPMDEEAPRKDAGTSTESVRDEPPVLIITDVQPCEYNEAAWFETNDGHVSKQVGSIGTLHTERGELIPCALVMTPNGILMPVFMVDGFVGMHKDGFSLPSYVNDDDEPFPPFAEEVDNESTQDTLGGNEDDIIDAPKRGLLSRVFGKAPKQSNISIETKDVIKEAINASG